jgi:hypothetical protein
MTIERTILITDQEIPWLRSYVTEAIGGLRSSMTLQMPVYTRVSLLNKIEGIPFQLSFNGHLIIIKTPVIEAPGEELQKVLKYCLVSGRGGQLYRWDRLVLLTNKTNLPDYLQPAYDLEPSVTSATHSLDLVEATSLATSMGGSPQMQEALNAVLGKSAPTLANIYAFSYRDDAGLASQLNYLRVLLGSSLAVSAYHNAAKSEFQMLRSYMKSKGLSWQDVLEPALSSEFGDHFFTTGQVGKGKGETDSVADGEPSDTPEEDFSDSPSTEDELSSLVTSPSKPKTKVLALVENGSIIEALNETAVAEYRNTSIKSKELCASLVAAIIHKESGGNPTAVSSTGYCGLGQVGKSVYQTFAEANPKYMASRPDMSYAWMRSADHVAEQLAVTVHAYTRALARARHLLSIKKVIGDPSMFSRDHVVLASMVYGAGGGNTNNLIKSAETKGYTPTLSNLYAHNPNWMKPYLRPFYHGMFVFINSALYRA